jgi:hypothetical protein
MDVEAPMLPMAGVWFELFRERPGGTLGSAGWMWRSCNGCDGVGVVGSRCPVILGESARSTLA